MENTKENKEKFFAQYWGQEVLFDGIDSDYLEPVNSATIHQVFSNIKRESWLQLTPLSKITHDDAIEAYMIIWECEQIKDVMIDAINKLIFDIKADDIEDFANISDFKTVLNLFDFFRSKGYALPYMGLSVETLIEYGWIKLK